MEDYHTYESNTPQLLNKCGRASEPSVQRRAERKHQLEVVTRGAWQCNMSTLRNTCEISCKNPKVVEHEFQFIDSDDKSERLPCPCDSNWFSVSDHEKHQRPHFMLSRSSRAVTKQLENAKSHMTSVGHQLYVRSDPYLKKREAEVLRSAEVVPASVGGQLQVARASRSERKLRHTGCQHSCHIATCECHVGSWKERVSEVMDGDARLSNADFAIITSSF